MDIVSYNEAAKANRDIKALKGASDVAGSINNIVDASYNKTKDEYTEDISTAYTSIMGSGLYYTKGFGVQSTTDLTLITTTNALVNNGVVVNIPEQQITVGASTTTYVNVSTTAGDYEVTESTDIASGYVRYLSIDSDDTTITDTTQYITLTDTELLSKMDTLLSDASVSGSIENRIADAVSSEMTYKGGFDLVTNTPRIVVATLTGTVDPDGTTTLTGTDTLFTSELEIGMLIRIGTEVTTVTNITSDTELTTESAFSDVDATTMEVLPIEIGQGDTYTVTSKGTIYGVDVTVGDMLIAEIKNPLEGQYWTILNRNIDESATSIAIDTIDGLDATTVQGALATNTASIATINGDVDTAGSIDNKIKAQVLDNIIDEDDMASDDDTKIPTQQSVKAYIAAQIDEHNEASEILLNSVGGLESTDVQSGLEELQGDIDTINGTGEGSITKAVSDLGTAVATDMANSYLDQLSDGVYSGLDFTYTASSLDGEVSAGMLYLNGKRVTTATSSNSFSADKDTYVDIDENGSVVYTEVDNGADEPEIIGYRVVKVVTNSDSIISYTIKKTNLLSIDTRFNNVYTKIEDTKTTTVTYIAEDGQTDFNIANSTTEPITVLLEGYPLIEGSDADFTRDSTKITLTSGADANEQLHIIAYNGK